MTTNKQESVLPVGGVTPVYTRQRSARDAERFASLLQADAGKAKEPGSPGRDAAHARLRQATQAMLRDAADLPLREAVGALARALAPAPEVDDGVSPLPAAAPLQDAEVVPAHAPVAVMPVSAADLPFQAAPAVAHGVPGALHDDTRRHLAVQGGDELASLVDSLADTVRAQIATGAQQWKVSLRLLPQVLPQTQLSVAGSANEVEVCFDCAHAETLQRLNAARDELLERLQMKLVLGARSPALSVWVRDQRQDISENDE
jgi:hypothetical protein